MRKYNLECPIRKANPYRRMAKAMKTSHVAPNVLNRQFELGGPRSVQLTDITYIPSEVYPIRGIPVPKHLVSEAKSAKQD